MSYSIKLKNQTGDEVIYNDVDQVALPLASGNGNAYYAAKYKVTLNAYKANGESIGNHHYSENAAHGVDYSCLVFKDGNYIDSITVTVGSKVYAYYSSSSLNNPDTLTIIDTESYNYIAIKGSVVTNDMIITVVYRQ